MGAVRTTARAEAQVAPAALAEILDYDFSRSHAITQMVAHRFDGLDAPQQIIAKVTSAPHPPQQCLHVPASSHLSADAAVQGYLLAFPRWVSLLLLARPRR